MKIRGVTENDLLNALDSVNKRFNGNIIFNRFERNGRGFNVTLRVQSSKEAGHRIGHSGRRMVSACWHVHGYFFDALPFSAIIKSSGRDVRPGDRWHDWNIGSVVEPLYYSQACECN
jgi:hypothetical protein